MMRKIAVVSMIAIFTMDTWAATIGRADTHHCDVENGPRGECFPTVAQTGRRYWEYVIPLAVKNCDGAA